MEEERRRDNERGKKERSLERRRRRVMRGEKVRREEREGRV